MYERGERPTTGGSSELDAGFGLAEEIPAPMSPVDWWKLDRLERAETLSTLADFVPELVRRFLLPDAVVPPCWYRHEPLIQELLGLFQLRQQANFLESAPATAPNDFHLQMFAYWVPRMRAHVAITSCNTAEHYEGKPPAWSVPGEAMSATWRTQVDEFVDENVKSGWPSWAPSDDDEGVDDGQFE